MVNSSAAIASWMKRALRNQKNYSYQFSRKLKVTLKNGTMNFEMLLKWNTTCKSIKSSNPSPNMIGKPWYPTGKPIRSQARLCPENQIHWQNSNSLIWEPWYQDLYNWICSSPGPDWIKHFHDLFQPQGIFGDRTGVDFIQWIISFPVTWTGTLKPHFGYTDLSI